MPICEICGREHDGSYGSGRFCSSKCNALHGAQKFKEKYKQNPKQKKIKEPKWETRICEKCGKQFLVDLNRDSKRHPKRFCGYSCANTHKHTQETKDKIRNSIEAYMKSPEAKYTRNSIRQDGIKRVCVICNKEFITYGKNVQTCSKSCTAKLAATTRAKLGHNSGGGYHENSVRGKSGWYKGIHCHSTYELYWVIYYLDHNIPFKRCNKVFDYQYNGNWYKYYPDFELSDGTIVEIKGLYIPSVDAKAKAVMDSGYTYIILYYKDLLEYIDYVNTTYNVTKNSIESLYEQYDGKITKICPICGKEFTTIHKSTQCCSRHCGAILASRNRKR